MVEDELLKWRFKNQSADALRRIYEKYEGFMLTLATALLNNRADAQDAVHDVFVSFAQSANRFRLTGSLKGYLARSVSNHVRDTIRSRHRRKTTSLDEAADLSTEARGPDESAILNEQTRLLIEAMAQLPYEQREVIILRAHAGLKFKAIAKLQNESINTAQSRYRYGLDKLRSILNSEVKK